MTDRTVSAVVALALAVSAVTLVGIAPPAGASHGAGTNFTVQPVDAPQDRRPGVTNASYKQFAHANRSIKRIDYFVIEWQAGVIGSCEPSDLEALGIDRGDDDPGTTTDEELLRYIESTDRSDHRVVADFWDEDDAQGESTHINDTDELVSHQTDCYGNSDEPGWYQITATVNGTGWDGNHVEMTVASHYFWICDCANEQEARTQLGPPPSEQSGQSTQSPGGATATSTQASGTPTTDSSQAGTPKTTDGSQTGTSTTRRTQTETPSVATATQTAVGTGSGTTMTTTPSEAAIQTETSSSPTTAGDGPGFGVLITVLAVFAVLTIKTVR